MRWYLRSKIHQAIVTQADVAYIGSITIDEDLVDLARLAVGEKVLVVSNTTGVRLETYVIPGPRGSGQIGMNGAAARLIQVGEEIIVMGFELSDQPIQPTIILVDNHNRFKEQLRLRPEFGLHVSGDQSPVYAALMARVAQRDRQAFLELYELTAPKAYGLALKIMSDPMAAEEVMQEAFLKLWMRAGTYRPSQGRLFPWLLTIVRHTALDLLRREARRPESVEPPEGEGGWGAWLEAPGSGSEEARWRSLYFAVAHLPEDQRLAITYAYYYGLSHSQIAAQLSLPLGTVKTRLRLGMERLRQAWLSTGVDSSQAGQSKAARGDVDMKDED